MIYIDIDWVCHSPIGGDGNREQGDRVGRYSIDIHIVSLCCVTHLLVAMIIKGRATE